MKYFKNAVNHFKTITRHRHEVMKNCFRAGIGFQGLFHDLSKYMPAEFLPGVRYFQGDRSPNEMERETIGYSNAWMHHKGRNRHHYEYWNDYNPKTKRIEAVKMPTRYFVEMVCDRIAASKIYYGENYTDESSLNYYLRKKGKMFINPETERDLEKILRVLAFEGENKVFRLLRRMVRKDRVRRAINFVKKPFK